MNDKTRPAAASPDSPRVAHALKPGDEIMEYIIERTLGGGGFGITYLARDKHLNLPVALKEYLPGDMAMRGEHHSVQPLGDQFAEQFQWGLDRFLDEARVLATFRHPNIVRVLRFFVANGTGYIVMEYESGKPLKQWPQRLSLTQAAFLRMLFPLLDGLEVVHNADFLHRDIKPDNIYIRDDGAPVLIDFGSARSTNSERELTNVVTPGFAPFEQYHGQGHQGPWTDLYSLAAVVYWLVSGEKPLDSLSRLKQDSMKPLAQMDTQGRFDAAVLAVFDWALNPDEKLRPQSVAEFRARLIEVAGDPGVLSPTGRPVGVDTGTWASRTLSGQDAPTGNLVSSILFTDIIAYSQATVNEQFELKTQFNQLIARKLEHIPENTRITLDTGDGAAVCFMGDPEEVLLAAIEIKDALQKQQSLAVRMGLHIGPVRVIADLNGRSNVIGDGINVAQRVMSFAGSNTLLVSRAFYEIVARLNDHSGRAFEYLGERRDKHDRTHEVYVVGSNQGAEEEGEKTILFSGISEDKTQLFRAGAEVDTGIVDFDLGSNDEHRAVVKLKVAAKRVRHEVTSRLNKETALRVSNLVSERAEQTYQGRIKPALQIARSKALQGWALGKREYAHRVRPAALHLWHEARTWTPHDFWWKQLVAAILAFSLAWMLAGSAWAAVAGLIVLAPGWIRFARETGFRIAKQSREEKGGQWLFSRTAWMRPEVRQHALLIWPTLAAILLLWIVVPVSGYFHHGKNTPAESAGENQSSIMELFSGDADTQATLKKARKMLAVGEYDEAIELANNILKRHPGNDAAQDILKQAKAEKKKRRFW